MVTNGENEDIDKPASLSRAARGEGVVGGGSAASAKAKRKGKRMNVTTLHELHTMEMKGLQTQVQKSAKVLHTRKERLKKERDRLQSTHNMQYFDHLRLYSQSQELTRINEQLKQLDDNPIAKYYINTGDILHQYYCNIDSISSGDDKRKRSISSFANNKGDTLDTTIIDYFGNINVEGKPKPADGSPHTEEEADQRHTTTRHDGREDPPRPPNEYQSRDVLLQRYQAIMNDDFILHNGNGMHIDIISHPCPSCGYERNVLISEASTVCMNCARLDRIVVDSNKPSYKDPPRDTNSYYSYKRINHFNEWLAQFQAKETTDIPDEVYGWILLELKKERRHNQHNISTSKMKSILKKLKLNKYYEHIPHITNRLNGQMAPVMNRATEEKLRSMFKEIQAPFIKHCPHDRKNFLSYSYVLHKFCELLNLDNFLPCFQLLKSREKLHQQDRIWRKICEELRWEFIKSV